MIGPKRVIQVDVPDPPGDLKRPDRLPGSSAKLLLRPKSKTLFNLMEDFAL